MTGLPVRYEGHVMGVVAPEGEDLSFAYHPRWLATPGAFPLSLRMPLGTAVFGGEMLRPWLANLLPEDTNLLGVGRTLGIAPQDVLGLLERIGRDTAGALSFGDAAHPEETPGYCLVGGPSDLERIIEELPAKPFLAGEEGVSMSLAGAQEKLPVAVMADGSLAIPVHGAASTHILKPDARQRFWGSVQNEALCLTLASLCGLPAAGATTGRAGERHYLLVSRYDRVQRNGRWVRLHQEDFCQALGKAPSAKYESNGIGVRGPGLPDLFAVAGGFLTAGDRTRLLDAVVFNVLTCNTDAHAKNYAILLTGHGPSLAPLYDVLCAEAWENVTKNLAMSIAGKTRGAHIKGRHWQRLADACGLNRTMILRRIETLASRARRALPDAADRVRAMPGGDHPMLKVFVTTIDARCRAVIANLAETD